MASKKEVLSRLLSITKGVEDDATVDNDHVDIFELISKKRDPKTMERVYRYLTHALKGAAHHLVVRGNLGTLLEQHPGVIYYYRGIYNDVQQCRRFLEQQADNELALKHKYYMYDPESRAEYGAVKTTDATKLANSDEAVVMLKNQIRQLAYYEHQFENLVTTLNDMKFTLHDIIVVKKEGLSDVWIDSLGG